MADFETETYSEAELVAEFERLFPQGFAGPDVLRELAPEGWKASPLAAAFHPTPAQLFEEALHMHRNLLSLRKPDDPRPVPPAPTLEETAREFREHPVETEVEVRELIGQCLWDVFSDGHEVIGLDDRLLDLGSFRGSGGFLADFLNRQIGGQQYDYLSFYMGTIWIAGRADLAPVYRLIFRRLHSRGLDWVYHFPRLYAVDLRPLKAALDRKDEPEWTSYDPSEALVKEEAEREQDKNLEGLRESLDEGYQEAIDESMNGLPPTTVRAYAAVYGDFPRGWPPSP
jgi:hypothetical protein